MLLIIKIVPVSILVASTIISDRLHGISIANARTQNRTHTVPKEDEAHHYCPGVKPNKTFHHVMDSLSFNGTHHCWCCLCNAGQRMSQPCKCLSGSHQSRICVNCEFDSKNQYNQSFISYGPHNRTECTPARICKEGQIRILGDISTDAKCINSVPPITSPSKSPKNTSTNEITKTLTTLPNTSGNSEKNQSSPTIVIVVSVAALIAVGLGLYLYYRRQQEKCHKNGAQGRCDLEHYPIEDCEEQDDDVNNPQPNPLAGGRTFPPANDGEDKKDKAFQNLEMEPLLPIDENNDMPFIDDSGKDLSGNVKDQRRYVNDGEREAPLSSESPRDDRPHNQRQNVDACGEGPCSSGLADTSHPKTAVTEQRTVPPSQPHQLRATDLKRSGPGLPNGIAATDDLENSDRPQNQGQNVDACGEGPRSPELADTAQPSCAETAESKQRTRREAAEMNGKPLRPQVLERQRNDPVLQNGIETTSDRERGSDNDETEDGAAPNENDSLVNGRHGLLVNGMPLSDADYDRIMAAIEEKLIDPRDSTQTFKAEDMNKLLRKFGLPPENTGVNNSDCIKSGFQRAKTKLGPDGFNPQTIYDNLFDIGMVYHAQLFIEPICEEHHYLLKKKKKRKSTTTSNAVDSSEGGQLQRSDEAS